MRQTMKLACQAKQAEPCSAKRAKNAKAVKCAKADKAGKCAKRGAAETVGKVKDKILEAASKVPAWLERAKKELEALIAKLQKLDEFIAKLLEAVGNGGSEVTWANVRRIRGTRAEIRSAQLLMKQRDAMSAYRDALAERIRIAEEQSK